MIFFKRKQKARLIPKDTGKPLSSHDVLVRLRECWCILSPRRPCELTADDVEIVGYNMKLAELYGELRALEKDSCGAIGFSGSDDPDEDEDDDSDDEDEDDGGEWLAPGEVYCGRRRQ